MKQQTNVIKIHFQQKNSYDNVEIGFLIEWSLLNRNEGFLHTYHCAHAFGPS